MYNYSAILSVQKKVLAAVFGIFFTAAVFFCQGYCLFQPLKNEFCSFLFLAAAPAVFAFSFLLCPGRKKSGFIFAQFLFVSVLVFLLYLITGKNVYPVVRVLILFSAAGWIAGLLRDHVFRPVHFALAGCGGMFTGLLAYRLLFLYSDHEAALFYASLAVVLWIMARLVSHWGKISAAGRILAMLLWLLFVLRVIAAAAMEHEMKHDRENADETLQPAMLAAAALQPDKKNMQVLVISDDQSMVEKLNSGSEYPPIMRLTVLSPERSNGVSHELGLMSEDYDLIILQLPLPDSLYAERFYHLHFYQLLKDHLEPHGVLAVLLPEDAMLRRKKHILNLYGSAGAVLKQVFPVIKSAGRDPLMILCGGENVTNSPDELNLRAKRLLPDPAGLPEGVFLMNTPEEIREQEEAFAIATRRSAAMNGQGTKDSLLWNCIRSHPAIDQTGLGMILDQLRENLLYVLTGIVILLLVVRYFCSGKVEEKRNWMSMENGTFTGLVLFMLLIPFQQIFGRLHADWHLLFGLLLFTMFCGLLTSAGNLSSLLRKLLFGFTLLVPLCSLAFLQGYAAESIIYYLLIAYLGYTAGVICGDLQSEVPETLLGFSLGLVCGSVLYWLPGGMIFAVILAVLLRIPPIAAENLRKLFDKRKKKYNI